MSYFWVHNGYETQNTVELNYFRPMNMNKNLKLDLNVHVCIKILMKGIFFTAFLSHSQLISTFTSVTVRRMSHFSTNEAILEIFTESFLGLMLLVKSLPSTG